MSCKLELNKQGKITGVLDQNGNKSTLFQRIFNTPTLTLNEVINAYKSIYSDKLKGKVKFQQVFPAQKPAPKITQELINRLKQSGLSEDVFLLSTEEINNKLKELGVSEDVRKQVKDASEILNVFHGTSKDKEFKKFKDTGKGIFVTTSTEDASDYALQNDSMKFGDYDHVSGTFKELNTASRVIPLKLLKENVYTLTAEDLKFLNSSPNYGKLQKELHTKIKNQGFDVIDYGKGVYAVLTSDRLTSLITGETMFSKSLNNVGINLITNGFTYNNQVFLNSDTATDETAIHEFNHLYNNWLKQNRPQVYNKGLALISAELKKDKSEIQEIINFVKVTQPNLAGEKLYEEILTELVGRRGIEILIKKETSKSDVLSWLAEVWQEIKNMLGLSSYTDAQILNMTLMEFADASAIDLLSGEVIKGSQAQQYFTREADRLPLTLALFNTKPFQDLQGKQVNPITVQQLLNKTGIKQIEKDLINQVIEDNYKGQKRISYDELEATVRANIMPLERITTSSYADYGMDNLGNGNYGNANTLILNSPIEHGVTGHFSGDFKASGRQNIKYQAKQLNDNTWVAVEEGYESQANDNNIYQYVGTAGTKEAVDAWIENYTGTDSYKVGQKIETYKGKGTVLDVWEDGTPFIRYENGEESALRRQDREEVSVNKGMFGHIRTWLNNAIFYVAELQSDYYQKNNARKGILQENKKYQELLQKHATEIVILKDKRDDYIKLLSDSNYSITNFQDGNIKIQNNLNTFGLPLGDSSGVEIIDTENGFTITQNGKILGGNYYYKKELAESSLRSQSYKPDYNVIKESEEVKKGDLPANLKEAYDYVKETYEKEKKSEIKKYNLAIERVVDNLSPQEKQFIASQKIWEQRMVREAIKEASLSGATSLRFPTPYTLSVIEGYVTIGEEDKAKTELRSAMEGEIVNYLGTEYIVEYTDIPNGGTEVTIRPVRDFTKISYDAFQDMIEEEGEPDTYVESYDGEFVYYTNSLYNTSETIDTKDVSATKEGFSIENDLSDTQQTVARKYEEIAEILKKEKPVEIVTDENGFDWYEVKITPEDTQKPVVAFQMSNAEITSKVNDYLTKINKAKKENPKQYWSVDIPSNEVLSKGSVVENEGGMAVVTEDGNIVGVFKDKKEVKGVADKLLQKAISLGGVKLDNYDGYLTKIYERNGFRVVSRLSFNEKVAPKDWNKEVNGAPDIVFMVYDPNSQLNIQEKSFDKDSYNDALAYRDSFIEEAKKTHPFYKLSQNNTGKTQAFFSDVVEGKSEKYKAKKEWASLLAFTQAQQFFKGLYDRFKGNFDNHIATSIPTFRETQIKVGATLVKMLQNSSNPLIYDIGGSEGGFVKAITQASNGTIKSINLDVNDSMEAVHNATPVEGSTFIKEAFYEGYTDEDTGVTYKKHVPQQKADVVHESMVFQFISPERGQFIKEVKNNYLKEDGILLLEEKLVPETQEEWLKNEELKDSYKRQFYSQAEITEKQEEILTGMLKNQTKVSDLLSELNKNFDYVGQYWESGNFKGFIATNSKQKYDKFFSELGGKIEFLEQVVEPSPNFNGYTTYKEAVINTPINEKIKIQIDDVVIAEITNNGDINDLIRQGIIEDRRELEPSGAITYKTSGANLTMKLVNSHIAKEVLGGKINKAGDIRTEQKEEVEISDNFETNKKELGENAAISILASDALADNTPAFGVGRIITEEIEIPSETVLMTKLKGLLNQLGVKSMSLEAWEKKNGKKAASNALADIGNQIVAFADGKITEDQLSEETAHFIIEALDQEQIKPLLEVVHKTDEWKQYAQTYMEIYKDEAIVRREILGKVLKNALQRKAQETLQGQSVVDRIIGFFNNFINSVRNLLSDKSRQQLDKFTNEVYEKLMAEELYNELSPEQFDGNKLVMYQAQVNDTVYQSISKLTKQMGVIDRRLNSAQKETLSQIEKNLEMADEAMQLEALAGLASVLKKHVTYLNTRGRKQGFLSTEESFVYNTTEDIGKALNALLPKIEISVFKKEKEKALESAKEALTALNELSANLNKEKEDRFQDIVTDLVEKNGLSEQQKDVLLKELRTQTRDTNTFYSWFGGAIHAQNSILNMLAKRVSKMNKETNAVFSQEANTFFSKMNELGFKDEQIAPLMKKWARGNYLFSPYDFVAEEMQANKIRLEVIKKEAKDVYDEYLKTLKTEDKVLEHFSKNQDEWLSKLTQEQNSNYRYLAKEAISDAGLRLDALNKAEREDFNKVMKSLNLSLKTKKLIQEFKDKKNRIFRESKINNGFSEEDLQQLQEINSDYQIASEPYDKDGNIKDGLLIDENGVITASVPKDQLEDDVRVTLELNEYREALKQLYAGKERNVFEGFFNQLQEVKNSATDPIERRRNIENFIKLNTRVFYTEEFWQQSDKNDSIVNKLLELETEEATQIAEEIEFLNRKLKNILKRNKLYNRPSQIDFEFMSAADESEVKDLVTHLETKFREAKTQLPKSEGQTIERAFQSVTNEAYQKELTNRAIAVSNSGVNNEQFVKKLNFIRQHVTDEGMRSINRIRDRVASFDLTKDVPKGLNITKEELMADKNKAVLDYAETKLMPYFKVIQSNKEGASQAENNLIFEMGQSQNAQELESVYNKYKTEYFIDASPSFIFEDADTSDRLSKEYKKRLESNEPLLSDKFFNKEFFDYFGINIGQGFSIDTAVATKNQKEFEAWKATVGFQEKVLEYGSMKGKHNKYLLPQYRRGTYARGEQIAKGMSREKIKEAFNDAFTYREDDPALGQNVDGEIAQLYQKNSLVIPKTGFRRLESETEVTDELLYSYMLMMREAVKFNKRTEAWADVEAMEHYIKGKTYGDKFGEATHTYEMFNDFKRYNIYGQKETWSWETDMYGLLSKKQNLAPAVNFFQRYVRNNNLAYSILTPMTSFLQGTTNFFVENLVGDRINKDASRLASKEMPKLMTQASSEFFNVRAKSKLNLLLQFMGQDSPSERFDNSNYGRALRGASIYKLGYISHYLGDVPIQAQTTLTVLHDYRIVGNDILDYYTWRRKNRTFTEKDAKAKWKTYQDDVIYNHIKPTKDGSLEVDQTVKNIDGWETKLEQIRNKLTIAKQDIDNQISDGDKGKVQRHALLSWTTLHKGWLVTSMTKRFKEQHLNLFNNMMEEGTYRGTFYFLTNFMKDIKSKGVKNAWKENFKGYDGGYRLEGNIIYDDKGDILKAFDNKKEAEEYYEELKYDFAKMRQISVTRAGIDLVLTSALATLGILLSKMADDDDDDFVKEFVAYSTFRLASEVSSQSFAFPAQAYAFLESPTVGMSQLQNSLDVLDVFDTENITRGNYKGYSKQQAWFLKAIPGIKELGKLYNIDRTRNSFEFYNAKNLKFTVAGQILLED